MKPLEESAVIRYIENNHYQLTIRQVAECFGTSMVKIKELLKRKNIKLKYEQNLNYITKGINEEIKKNQEEKLNVRKVDPAHINWYRNKLNINLNLAKNPITVRHTDIGLEDVWDKIKHEYVYTVICPFERTYEIKRRLSDEKLQEHSIRRDIERQKDINNKKSATGNSNGRNDNSVSNKRIDTKFKRGNNMSKINQEIKDKFIKFYIEQKKLKKIKKEIATEQQYFSYTTAVRVMKDVDNWTEEEMKEFEVRQSNRLSFSSEVMEEPVSEVVKEFEEQFEEELKNGEIVEFEDKKYKFVETNKFTSDDCQKCDLFAKHIIDEEECICSNYAYNVTGYFEEIEVAERVVIDKELKNGETIKHNNKNYKFVYTGSNDCVDCNCCDIAENENNCICAGVKSEYIQGYFVEVSEEDKCTECDIEAAHIINELSAKNQELQKELHTSKNVITTLQKGIEELNETVTESKIIINEICKERDDKDEKIRVLRLDLLRKDNDMDKLVEDFREAAIKYENLLEVLETKKLNIELNPKYDSLYKVLLSAYNQASNGKGKERHANDEPFDNQKIITLNKQIGSNHGAIFQACKKAQESARLPKDRAIMELLGAINYLAAAVIMLQQGEKN